MRTYSREDWFRAKAEWDDFGPEWRVVRELAREAGYIFPPTGSRHDDRDAENPSQRAIVYRALVDNPRELHKIVARCRSWNGVVASIIGLETRLRLDADDLERDVKWDKVGTPDHKEAVRTIAEIIKRIGDAA